ncbi:PglD-related sugar-binding protein [Enterococcus dispar]|uniref:PglD-related sugar-binding protein n=1 Tax=Enterococcus dispar TaxID=44009 RepID=UPI0023303F58|nr:hypothetical protein [Enterococcus dispar]WCG34068.1 hypothetical protein PML78_05115 [Enterococcus dispar]
MKDIIIVGAGGLGRKIFACLNRINKIEPTWNVLGFIDDNSDAFNNVKIDSKIIGSISDYTRSSEREYLALALSDVNQKETISNLLLEKGGKFATIVSPEAILGDYVEIGEGSIVMTPYNIESGAKIGKFVTVLGSTLALDGVIGDYSTTAGFANLTNAKIGKKVYVASHVVLTENLTIGDDSIISVGSIVMKNVKAGTKVFGYPARVF